MVCASLQQALDRLSSRPLSLVVDRVFVLGGTGTAINALTHPCCVELHLVQDAKDVAALTRSIAAANGFARVAEISVSSPAHAADLRVERWLRVDPTGLPPEPPAQNPPQNPPRDPRTTPRNPRSSRRARLRRRRPRRPWRPPSSAPRPKARRP